MTDGLGLTPEKSKIDKEKLANLLYNCLKDITIEELVGLLTNKYDQMVEYSGLYNNEHTCKMLSLLFNPHRLDIKTGSNKESVYSITKKESFAKSIARTTVFLKKREKSNFFYRALEIGTDGVGLANEFPPHIARELSIKHCLDSTSRVLDPCAGWGGRMIGFSTVVNNYECYEPSTKTYEGLKKLNEFIKQFRPEFNATIHCLPFEDSIIIDNSFDFALTSPPYFDTEKYTNEKTNSFIRYSTFDSWVQYFYLPLISKTMATLKFQKYFILNIGDRKYPLSKILKENFEKVYEIKKLTSFLSGRGGLRSSEGAETFWSIRK